MARCNARELTTGAACTQYIQNIVQRVQMYLSFGVEIVMVFDGSDLPLKAGTNSQRHVKRQAALQRAAALDQQNRSVDANNEYSIALEVTPAIAQSLIMVLKQMNVECIVAPYEADAQLAYLAHSSYIDVVITEDSDLIAYLTPSVLFKVDHGGKGILIQASRLADNTDLPLGSFSEDMLLTNLVLAGCDYSQSLKGIGIKKANRLVAEHKTLPKILEALRSDAKYAARGTDGLASYEYEFLRAFFAFKHHIVFDPRKAEMRHFRAVNPSVPLDPTWVESVLGKVRDKETSVAMCLNHTLCPVTLESYHEKSQKNEQVKATLRNAETYLQNVAKMLSVQRLRGKPAAAFGKHSWQLETATTTTTTMTTPTPNVTTPTPTTTLTPETDKPSGVTLKLSPPQLCCLGVPLGGTKTLVKKGRGKPSQPKPKQDTTHTALKQIMERATYYQEPEESSPPPPPPPPPPPLPLPPAEDSPITPLQPTPATPAVQTSEPNGPAPPPILKRMRSSDKAPEQRKRKRGVSFDDSSSPPISKPACPHGVCDVAHSIFSMDCLRQQATQMGLEECIEDADSEGCDEVPPPQPAMRPTEEALNRLRSVQNAGNDRVRVDPTHLANLVKPKEGGGGSAPRRMLPPVIPRVETEGVVGGVGRPWSGLSESSAQALQQAQIQKQGVPPAEKRKRLFLTSCFQ